MGVDALVAVAAGRLYDRSGLSVVLILPVASFAAVPLSFAGSTPAVWAGIALWGAALGVQESVMRAVVADLVPVEVRGIAYGIFNMGSGLAWFAGSTAMGLLYDAGVRWVVAFAAVAQALAVPLLLVLLRRR